MSTAIICAVLIVIAIIGLKSYAKKLTSGCCGASSQASVKKIKVSDKDKSHYPYSRILKVDGMSCGNCACHVENALNSLEGVWAQVDLEKGEALVRMKQKYGNNELKQAVKDAGYVVYKIEEIILTGRGSIYGFGGSENIRRPEKSIASRDKRGGCSAG